MTADEIAMALRRLLGFSDDAPAQSAAFVAARAGLAAALASAPEDPSADAAPPNPAPLTFDQFAAYLGGTMTEAAQSAFEAEMLASEDLLHEVMDAMDFLDAVEACTETAPRHLSGAPADTGATPPAQTATVVPMPPRHPRPPFTMPTVAAAAGGTLRQSDGSEDAVRIVSPSERSGRVIVLIQLKDPNRRPKRLRVKPPEGAAIEEKLDDPDNRGVIQLCIDERSPRSEQLIYLLEQKQFDLLDDETD